MIQDYPMMIYHVAAKPLIINTPEELEAHLKAGWIQTPIEGCETVILQKQIAFHKAEAERIGLKLARLGGGVMKEPEADPGSREVAQARRKPSKR